MKVISVTNRKGGVGKTTVSTHLAAGLATQGMKIALIDTDSQGHAGLPFGVAKEDGLYSLLIDRKPIDQVVRFIPPDKYSTADNPSKGELWLIPSSEQTYKIPHALDQNDQFSMLRVLDQFGKAAGLDAVIFDTTPSLSKLDGVIWLATDAFIYVSEVNRLSFDGLEGAVQQLIRYSDVRKEYLNRTTTLLGIVPNKVRARTRLHRNNIAALGNAYKGLIWSPIPLGVVWEEATNDYKAPQLLYTFAPSSGEAAAAWDVVTQAMGALALCQTN